ncbi:MAG: Fic family protein, partial [Candidatus Gracilibacteria bacterium]|nr:Fic family protein [Candidatus Gracilibacteria bacterium]
MKYTKNTIAILNFIKDQKKLSYTQIHEHFSHMNESTLVRNLQKLTTEGEIKKIKTGKNTSYTFDPFFNKAAYFDIPFFERPKKQYNFEFLANYIPNTSSFLGEKYTRIKEQYVDKNILSTFDYQENIRAIENLMIDLSFSSSKMEGNTYSYLDTEILIKYNSSAEGKSQFETQMILNHKNAIKYIIENRKNIQYSKIEFQNIHTLLAQGLLTENNLGKIRNTEVKIGGSPYIPLDSAFQLEEQFMIFLEKLNQIRNPFEQSLFILVFIPYFQMFIDINKRVSRICTNIPLIKNGFVPFSFLQINDKDYITAILSIYELNDTSLMRDV